MSFELHKSGKTLQFRIRIVFYHDGSPKSEAL